MTDEQIAEIEKDASRYADFNFQQGRALIEALRAERAEATRLKAALATALGYWSLTFDGREYRGAAQYKTVLAELLSTEAGAHAIKVANMAGGMYYSPPDAAQPVSSLDAAESDRGGI